MFPPDRPCVLTRRWDLPSARDGLVERGERCVYVAKARTPRSPHRDLAGRRKDDYTHDPTGG